MNRKTISQKVKNRLWANSGNRCAFTGCSEILSREGNDLDGPGAFIVEINTETGIRFSVDIKRSDSSGVSKMKVFCYDLMRAELWSKRNVAPRFLIHDSTLFDGVDERQVAKALELAESKSRECGFQYIVCLNSDNLPSRQFSEHFDLEKFVRLRLTDHEPSGRLLGIEY